MDEKLIESPLKALLNSPRKSDVNAKGSGSSSMGPPQSVGLANRNAPHTSITPSTSAVSNIAPGDPYSTLVFQNAIATVNLDCELDMNHINSRTRNSEYNPARFHGVVMRIREPRSTALAFKSGKLLCVGAKNEHQSLLATRKFARIIQKIGYNVKFKDFKIQNLVATCDLRFSIRLENLNQMHFQFSSYEPELFPALVYRLVKPRVVFLIFVNGKMVITGGKSRQEIKEALDTIYPLLKSFRKS